MDYCGTGWSGAAGCIRPAQVTSLALGNYRWLLTVDPTPDTGHQVATTGNRLQSIESGGNEDEEHMEILDVRICLDSGIGKKPCLGNITSRRYV